VEEISGLVTQGTINVDGTSAVRRSCNLTMTLEKDHKFTNHLWSLESKIKLYTGLKNNIDNKYPDIIWIPQGLYLLTSFTATENLNNITVNIQGRDKMALLDGTIGGLITANSVDFGTLYYYDEDTKISTKEKIKLKDIIIEAVHEYAREPFDNIIVKDLDTDILEMLEYRGKNPLYIFINEATKEAEQIYDQDMFVFVYETKEKVQVSDKSKIKYNQRISSLTTDIEDITPTQVYLVDGGSVYTVVRLEYGDSAGYRLTDLVYPGDFVVNVGTSITSGVLDKIKQVLGNFEYFYNLDGQFVF
jgi:hypothetical protein